MRFREPDKDMNRRIAALAMAGLFSIGMAAMAQADETFIPKGFLYRPGDTRLPPINSRRYKIISEADRREAEIYVSKKMQAEFNTYMLDRFERVQDAPRPGWRRY